MPRTPFMDCYLIHFVFCSTLHPRCARQVMEILCMNEGGTVSSALSRYFGDSEETVSEAMANEVPRPSNALNSMSDLLTPPEVSCKAQRVYGYSHQARAPAARVFRRQRCDTPPLYAFSRKSFVRPVSHHPRSRL